MNTRKKIGALAMTLMMLFTVTGVAAAKQRKRR